MIVYERNGVKIRNTIKCISVLFIAELVLLFLAFTAPQAFALASNNIPLDSPVYSYIEKLAGFGLIDSDVKGVRPYSRSEAARLYLEAEGNLSRLGGTVPSFSTDVMQRLRELLPREVSLHGAPKKAPLADYNPLSAAKLRYVYLDGVPRSYNRDVHDPAHQSAFGFIGGDLRPLGAGGTVHQTGMEGTPLLENNDGVIYDRGSSVDFRWTMEGYVADKVAAAIEPRLLHTPLHDRFDLQKGYVKIGGGGLELEAGRDANWFGPGFRGATTLTNNAKNFDLIKLSSPEPLDVGWVKRYLGDFKYAFILSRFDATGSGADYRRPYFIGLKLSLKPKPWFEIGGNLVRQEGGPGFSGKVSLKDQIFGGGDNDHINSIAGVDLRFRIPWLRNTEVFGEYAGEDSASFWPIVESYVAGFFIPRLTADGRNDLRFEYYWGSVMAYGDWQFPAGYVYHGMTPGHSQGGAAQDFFLRYSHWFSPRNNLALEYFHTERGNVGRLTVNSDGRFDPSGVLQAVERKNAARLFWNFPLIGDLDANLMYGWERINNFNLVAGAKQTNQLLKVDLSYRY